MLHINQIKKFLLKQNELRGIQRTFENRILDALPVFQTNFGNLPKAFLPCWGGCVDIIRDKNQHKITSRGKQDIRPNPHGSYGRARVLAHTG